ncbi:MAG TPA: ATP-binding protein [Burkholderiales bacterium]|jgi:signal transduction histidine kinase/CheY-like chemotaxis protein|nr:ATP-binding protein [Burkholderiales bacterium]
MASEHILLLPKAEAREVAGVDPRLLLARQIRLYIETAPVFHLLAVGFVVGGAAGLLWLYAPEQGSTILLWGLAIVSMLLVRLVAWTAYSRARPDDDAVRGWLKWFVVPHACSMAAIGVAPLLLAPSTSGHETEILLTISLLVYVVAVGSAQKLSAYRPVIPLVLGPMVLAYVASMLWFPGIAPKVLAFGGVVAGLWSQRMAASFNRSIVQSMELSIRNENLVAALEAHGARLREQTAIAEDARRAAEHAERAKTRFLAAASHDLRQPMHAISLLVGTLHPRSSGPEREIMARLERSVDAMDGLFSAILDLSKLDSDAVKPEMADVPLRAIFETIERHFGPEAAAKNLALSVFASRAVVKTDAALLERALRNLVSNAIKYTHEGRVLVGCRRRGKRLLIAVWDTGIGIAADHLDQVFEEYFQVDDLPRDRSHGLGLGLSIVRRLARLLGSEIEVSSVAGAGSRFGFEVPLVSYRRVDTGSRAAEPGWRAALEGKFILVVDDEPDARFGTEALLREWGCHSASAGSLAELAATLEREPRFPDAVIADYRIGERDTGLDAIAAVHAYTGENTPALIVTGEEFVGADALVAAAICPVVKKPVAVNDLRRHLLAALQSGAGVMVPALGDPAAK